MTASPSASYLKEMNRQAERYIEIVMGMTRSMLKTSGMHDKFWDLPVQHATHLKICLLSPSLSDRSPYEMVFQYRSDLSHVPIFGSRVEAWVPLQEREGKLVDRIRGREVCRPFGLGFGSPLHCA